MFNGVTEYSVPRTILRVVWHSNLLQPSHDLRSSPTGVTGDSKVCGCRPNAGRHLRRGDIVLPCPTCSFLPCANPMTKPTSPSNHLRPPAKRAATNAGGADDLDDPCCSTVQLEWRRLKRRRFGGGLWPKRVKGDRLVVCRSGNDEQSVSH